MTARPFVERDEIVRLLLAHRWKAFALDGTFVCQAGCRVLQPQTPGDRRASNIEAKHQADVILGVAETDMEKP